MEDFPNRVDSIDLTLDLGYLIVKEKSNLDLVLAIHIVSRKPVIMDSLLHVHHKNWTKLGGLDLETMDRCTFIFYFEDPYDMNFVMRKAPWSFDNSLLAIQRLLPDMNMRVPTHVHDNGLKKNNGGGFVFGVGRETSKPKKGVKTLAHNKEN